MSNSVVVHLHNAQLRASTLGGHEDSENIQPTKLRLFVCSHHRGPPIRVHNANLQLTSYTLIVVVNHRKAARAGITRGGELRLNGGF